MRSRSPASLQQGASLLLWSAVAFSLSQAVTAAAPRRRQEPHPPSSSAGAANVAGAGKPGGMLAGSGLRPDEDGQWTDLSRVAPSRLPSGAVSVDHDGYLHPVKVGAAQVMVAAGGSEWRSRDGQEPGLAAGQFCARGDAGSQRTGCNAGRVMGSAKGKTASSSLCAVMTPSLIMPP